MGIYLNIAHFVHCENKQKCDKNWMFLKPYPMESTFFFEIKEGCKVSCVNDI